MTTGSNDQPIRLEPQETCPPSTALVVGFQRATLVLAPTVLNVAIAVRSSGLDDTYLTWSAFAALLISAAVTALQAFQFRRFGAGYIVLTCPAALFIGIMVATVTSAGPSTFASLMVVCCVIQIALARWLPNAAPNLYAGCYGDGDHADRRQRAAHRVRQRSEPAGGFSILSSLVELGGLVPKTINGAENRFVPLGVPRLAPDTSRC